MENKPQQPEEGPGTAPGTGTLLEPDWPAPPAVRACTTTRWGGSSNGFYASLNLADHVGDDAAAVAANRARLADRLQLPKEPAWLSQVHGTHVISAAGMNKPVHADGSWTRQRRTVCAVLTADCLPVLLCDRDASVVAAAHAGWRGLAAGILEETVAAMRIEPESLLVWLGPAIGAAAYETGPGVRDAFLAADPQAAAAFQPAAGDRCHTDLYMLARQRLAHCGVDAVFGGGLCTFSEPERFFSYRRDGACGRMASLIWME